MILDALIEKAKAATPGPWEAKIVTDEEGETYVRGLSLGEDFIETDGGFYGPEPANATYIATFSPEVVIALCEVAK